MKIREKYGIRDRIKLMCILVIVLQVLIGLAVYTNVSKGRTIESFLKTALEPVGKTMYIWGGGWDSEDNAAGAGSTQIGVSPKWEKFARKQEKDYDFNLHRFERENGLDCSGYVGWVIYNTFETKSGKTGYVTTSTDLAKSLADRGWGVLIQNPKEFLPGDIVSMEGHVWICLGTCRDGSVLLVHSSPPGVSVCGTKKGSAAEQLATEFMEIYYPNWQEKYPNRVVSESYLENVSVFRWSEEMMSDAEVMQELKGEEIMRLLSFHDIIQITG